MVDLLPKRVIQCIKYILADKFTQIHVHNTQKKSILSFKK